MRTLIKTVASLMAIFVVVTFGVQAADCGGTHESKDKTASKMEEAKKLDIVETALANEGFTTLVAAVQAADLVEALKGEGPFTVFAPTDEAFAQLPEGAIEGLLEDQEELVRVLTYHVVSGQVMADQAAKLTSAETLQGGNLKISKKEDGLYINDAKIIATDIVCSNGVIHVIDGVVFPEKE